MVGAEAPTHSSLCTDIPWQRNQTSHKRLPHLPRVQKKDGARLQPTSTAIIVQRSELHNALATASQSIFSILPFAVSTTNLPKEPSRSFGLLPIIPLCHNQPSLAFANSTNNIPSASTTNHIPDARPQFYELPQQNDTFPPMTQSLQSPEVLTPISTPRGNE
jgi:hypothetical protein